MDALLIHQVLSEEDLYNLLGISRKEVRSLCAKLKEDHLLADIVQKEEAIGHRASSKTYYYIHYTETIDAIKWKMHSIETQLREKIGADAQSQGYICDVCKTRYSTIDIVATYSSETDGFQCDVCGNPLREEEAGQETAAFQGKLGLLMGQIQPIINTLRKIDELHIAENTFQSSLAQALPVPAGHDGVQVHVAHRPLPDLAVAKKGSGNTNTASLQVSITSDQETRELERKQKEERARLAEENALPTWHVESTVGKTLYDSSSVDNDKDSKADVKLDVKDENVKPESVGNEDQDRANEEALAAYYAELAKQQQEENEDEEDDDDDDDAEFEDVPVGTIDDEEEEDDEE